jgi:predicted nucleic acid-binding protein
MRPVFIDSSVWIAFFNGQVTPKTTRLGFLLGRQPLAIGDLVLMEVLQGFRYEADVRRAERLLAPLDCYILGGDALARASARNYRRLRRLGITPRSSIDVLIGTFCAENDHHVLACDRDFELMAPHLGFVLA